MLKTIDILGVSVTAEKEDKILEDVVKKIENGEKFTIVTPNPEILIYAKRHKPYQNMLNKAAISLPDGVGVVLAAKLLQKPLKTRITGVDFIENLCQFTREKPLSMGFLGGRAGIAERAAECLRKKYPWIRVVFAGEFWDEAGLRSNGSHASKYHSEGLHNSESTIDILFVAFGAPKQESWIEENLERLPVTAAMGVGGALDFLSGKVMRAPFVIRSLGMEWLFRLLRQPWRWRRQLALFEFMWLVCKELMLQKRKSPKAAESK